MIDLSNDQKAIALLGGTLIQLLKALDHPKEASMLDERLKGWINEILKDQKAQAKKRDSSGFKIILPETHSVEKELPPETQT